MGLIEKPKTYVEKDLETIFFRPMFVGENAEQLGIRVMYNMPMPTTIQMWSPNSDVLKRYSAGWNGGDNATRVQKRIDMSKLKAEVGFSASDYFQSVYELIAGRADVNLDDLTGTELEQAETELFRASIAESLRVMMWIGSTRGQSYNMMDGFIHRKACFLVTAHADNLFHLAVVQAVPLFNLLHFLNPDARIVIAQVSEGIVLDRTILGRLLAESIAHIQGIFHSIVVRSRISYAIICSTCNETIHHIIRLTPRATNPHHHT